MNMIALAACSAALVLCAGASAGGGVPGADPVRVLLVTGKNNHNWQYTSRLHKDTLEASGRFVVDIADDAPTALGDSASLANYAAIVLDYNGPRWGEPAESNFVKAVARGTGVVFIHAANNAFPGWAEYEQMCGLLWREGTGHGRFHEFDVAYTDTTHPITSGLADMTAHPDELYHKLVNTQKAEFRVLASARSTTESGGTGQDEPMAITLTYGKGRVFHTPLGHVWTGSQDSKRSISDPQFKVLLARGTEWAATGAVTVGPSWTDQRAHNTLTEAEKAAGWKLLFDGATTKGFRGFKKEAFPAAGWAVEGGALRHIAGGGGGDIITNGQYTDFEFTCEWKAAPGANSGIFYRVAEHGDYVWQTGPEMQVLDNALHQDGKNPKTSAGALYGLIECAGDVVRPADEWNSVRIVVRGNHVEHWVNGWRVLAYELLSPEWEAMIAASKFKDMPGHGREKKGHLAFQDHGDDVWFRNMKVRAIE